MFFVAHKWLRKFRFFSKTTKKLICFFFYPATPKSSKIKPFSNKSFLVPRFLVATNKFFTTGLSVYNPHLRSEFGPNKKQNLRKNKSKGRRKERREKERLGRTGRLVGGDMLFSPTSSNGAYEKT